MNRLRGFSALGSIAIAIFVSEGIARAQSGTPSSSELAAARAWFKEGIAFEQAAHWADALDRFRRANEVKHTPEIGFHVALCEAKVGLLVESLVDYDRAFDLARGQNNDKVEQAVREDLAALRPRVPHLRIVTSDGDKIEHLTIDGNAIASVAFDQPVPVNPGAHQVVIDFTNGRFTTQATLKEGATVEINAKPVDALPPKNDGPETTPHGRSTLGFWVMGAGVLTAGVSVAFWVMRASTISELDEQCGSNRQSCPTSAQDTVSAGKRDATIAVTLSSVGAAVAITGLILVLTRPSASTSSTSAKAGAFMSPAIFPGGAGVIGRF